MIQSGPSVTLIPQARRLSAVTLSRSLSFTRTLPTPVMVTGAAANGAIAARVGMVSEISRMPNSPPSSWPGPVSVIDSSSISTRQPMAASTSVPNLTSPCADREPSPGMVTRFPVTAAAARK